jgi:hypothetical protein
VTRVARRLALLAALVLTCALPVGSAQAMPSRDNIATAVIEQDDGHAFEFAWDLSKQRGGVVDHLNAANAGARCVRCGATAIAFQVVIASGARVVTPVNRAVAITDHCTECVVAAEARQFVRVVDRPVRLTGEGRATLADVRDDLRALEDRDLTLAAIHAAVEQQEARVLDVLNHELVLKSDPDTEPDVLEKRLFQAADQG